MDVKYGLVLPTGASGAVECMSEANGTGGNEHTEGVGKKY